MTDDLSQLTLQRSPTAERPLMGLTVMVVEDSRFACEAMRLLCLRSGARIRRADCLASARRHLLVYRPSVVVVDLGLPDGSGAELIEELARSDPRVPVLLGTSGDTACADIASAAGADGFLEKPISSLAVFQHTILGHLPANIQPEGPRLVETGLVDPDPIALRDDLAHVADVLSDREDDDILDYIAQFLASLANCADDRGIADAAQSLATSRANGRCTSQALQQITDLVDSRLNERQAI